MNCLLFGNAKQPSVKYMVTRFPHVYEYAQVEQLNRFFGNMRSSKLKCQGMILDTEIQSFLVLSSHNGPYCFQAQLWGWERLLAHANCQFRGKLCILDISSLKEFRHRLLPPRWLQYQKGSNII